MVKKVLAMLKTKASALGFNEEELSEVANSIASNLTEETTDEQIEVSVNGVLPLLKLSQKSANRGISKYQKEMEDMKKQLEEAQKKIKQDKNKGGEGGEDTPAWFKKYQEDTDKRFAELKSQSVNSLRKEQISKLLKDKGTFGASKMRDFERMNFKDDTDFESYYNAMKEDVESYEKEVNASRMSVIKPFGQGSDKELSDAEIDAIVAAL